MADNQLAAGSVPGTGKDGRVTKGDVLAAVAGAPAAAAAATAIPTGAPTKVLSQVAVVAPDLGDRPEERVPMTRLRARVAERLLQSQATNAILTTFNEVNMAPVMEMRKRFQDKFEKEHGVRIGFTLVPPATGYYDVDPVLLPPADVTGRLGSALAGAGLDRDLFALRVVSRTIDPEPRDFPAIENRGEGIFLQLSSKAVDRWAKSKAVQSRAQALSRGHERWSEDRKGAAEFPGVEYILLHTLSHMLLQSIAMTCGGHL